MKKVLAAVLCFGSIICSAAVAQEQSKSAFTYYSFQSVLVADDIEQASFSVKKEQPWFTGRVLPSTMVSLAEDLTISEVNVVLKAGEPLGVATSNRLIACQKDAQIKFRLGKSRACLIDLDGDGAFDAWFRRAGGVVWENQVSRVSSDDFHPITPKSVNRLLRDDILALDGWSTFEVVAQYGSNLKFCRQDFPACSAEDHWLKPSEVEAQVSYMGGVFAYKKLEKGRLGIRVIQPPVGTLFN